MQTMNTNRAAIGRVGPKNSGLQRRGLKIVLLAAAIIVAFALGGQPAFASSDDLHLIGIVKTIDPRTGIIFVDVQSESCPGMRRFYADDLGAMGKYVNQTITFFIDSATCRDTAIHTIKVSRGIKK
jgi:hypothetical protein